MVMAVGTMLSRFTGFLRLAVLSAALGYTGLADAYNLANTTPNMVHDLVAGGVLTATALPVFLEQLNRVTTKRAWEEIGSVISLALAILAVASGLLALAAPWIIHLLELDSARNAQSTQVATFLLRLFAAQVFFYGAITVLTAVLNARRRFALAAFAPVVNNVVAIATLATAALLFTHRTLAAAHNSYGLLTLLGIGTTAGVAAQLLVMLPGLRHGIHIRWRWNPHSAAVRQIFRLSGWTAGFIITNQIALFVMLALAHGVNANGGASAWTYAYTFFQLPFGIAAVSIMNATQPELAEHWARSEIPAFRARLTRGLRATLSTMVPAAIVYLVLAGPIVQLVLAHGAAASTGTADTAGLLAAFAVGLPGFSAYLLLVRAYQATTNTRTVFFLYLFENGLNVVLAFVLVGPLGLVGLGLALSIAYTAAALLALGSLSRDGIGPLPGRVIGPLLRVGVASIALGVTAAWIETRVGGAGTLKELERVIAALASGVIVFFVVAAGGTALGGTRRLDGNDRRYNR